MTLVGLLVVLILLGLLLYIVNLLPIDQTIKRIIFAIAIVFVVIWLLQTLGLISDIRIR